MPLAQGMVQRPCHIVGQAFRPHLIIDGVLAAERGSAFEILAHLGGTVMNLIGGTTDKFGSLPDIEVHPLDHGLAHPVGPHDPGAEPLRMVDQDMKRRPLDGNARLLEPATELGENVVDETLIARVVCQPVHDVAAGMRGDGIDVWRRVHVVLPRSDRRGSAVRDMSCPRSTASTATLCNIACSKPIDVPGRMLLLAYCPQRLGASAELGTHSRIPSSCRRHIRLGLKEISVPPPRGPSRFP